MANAIYDQGYVLDFSRAVEQLPPDVGVDYVAYQNWRLHDPFLRHDEKDPIVKRREGVAKPFILGSFAPLQDIWASHEGFEIKAPGSAKIYLPGDEVDAVSVAHIVGTDLLNLRGAKAFQEAKLVYVTQNTLVPTDEAHRPQFSGWHDHVTSARHPIDLIYAFHTVLPTEFKVGTGVIKPPENALCRFGGEIEHRSQCNTGEPLQRLWGAILVLDASYRPPQQNPVFLSDARLHERFEASAVEILRRGTGSRAYEKPISVAEYAGHELSR